MNDLAMLMFGLSGGGSLSENSIIAEYFNIRITKEDTSYGTDTWNSVERLQFADNNNSWAYYLIPDSLIRVKIANPTKDDVNRLKVASCDAYFEGVLPCIYRVVTGDNKMHVGVLEFSYGDIYLITDEEFPNNVGLYINTSGAIRGSKDY